MVLSKRQHISVHLVRTLLYHVTAGCNIEQQHSLLGNDGSVYVCGVSTTYVCGGVQGKRYSSRYSGSVVV